LAILILPNPFCFMLE